MSSCRRRFGSSEEIDGEFVLGSLFEVLRPSSSDGLRMTARQPHANHTHSGQKASATKARKPKSSQESSRKKRRRRVGCATKRATRDPHVSYALKYVYWAALDRWRTGSEGGPYTNKRNPRPIRKTQGHNQESSREDRGWLCRARRYGLCCGRWIGRLWVGRFAFSTRNLRCRSR